MQSPRWVLPVELVLELAGQVVHDVPPCSVMYVPVAQAAQAPLLGAPRAVEKVPAEQLTQGEVSVPVEPGLDGLGKIRISEYQGGL